MTKYLNTREAAEVLGVTQRSVFNYLKAGKLKGTKTATGYWRIPADEVDRFLGVATTAQSGDKR